MTRRLQRNIETSDKIPFPKLPLPSRFHKIRRVKQSPAEPVPVSVAPKPIPLRKPRVANPVGGIIVPEPIIGGKLEPEPPTRRDEGDHTVEELDFADYQ
jgi:hypothetical protein